MLMLPSGKTVVYGGDRVFAVGLSKSIQKFIDYQDVGAKYTISTLKDFMGFGETERQSPLVYVEVNCRQFLFFRASREQEERAERYRNSVGGALYDRGYQA